MRERNRYLPGLRAWVGYSNAVVFYDRQDRAAGDGKLSFMSRIKYAMDAITSFSYKPLRLCFLLACFSVCLAALLGVSTIFSQQPIPLCGIRRGLSGVPGRQHAAALMGVLGEYLGRVYDEVRGRPLSIISRVYSNSEMMPVQADNAYEEMKPAAASAST